MTPEELINSWDKDRICKFNKSELLTLGVDIKTADILSDVGLPEDAAPFLLFGGIHNGKTIFDIYKTNNANDKFLVEIGIDGAGDAICLDILENNSIVACDHESNFTKRYMNLSVVELLHFISIYRDFAQGLIDLKGENAFIESNFTDKELHDLLSQFHLIDNKALERGTYWSGEIQNLKANREYYKKQENTR